CLPPPGQELADFLTEVQYLAGFPEQVPLFGDDLAARLAVAFARHPLVVKVEQVIITPKRGVQVRLAYRQPVLIVLCQASATASDGKTTTYVVDRHGVVLTVPADKTEPRLLRFVTRTRPAGPAGTPWGDVLVETAARTAGVLQPYQERLHLHAIVANDDDLVLTTAAGTRIRWGRSPETGQVGERSAEQKVQILLKHCAHH